MYCLITDHRGITRIEDISYWKKGSYKMESINFHLKNAGKKIKIQYFNQDDIKVDEIILGVFNKKDYLSDNPELLYNEFIK